MKFLVARIVHSEGDFLLRSSIRKAMSALIHEGCFNLHKIIFVLVIRDNLEEDVALKSVL